MRIAPQPGPQTDLLACGSDVVLYGGAAGGGKSHGLLLDALRYHRTPGWAGLVLRRHRKDLTGGGTIFEAARKLYGPTGASFREGGSYIDVRWSSGATLTFAHLDDANVDDYQGKEYAWIGIDEATHVQLPWIRYLMTRSRTTCGSKSVVRMTCNPDPDHALREWVDWYLAPDGTADRSKSGVVRYFAFHKGTGRLVWGQSRGEAAVLAERPPNEIKSFTFIASVLEDNKILLQTNPDYAANLGMAGPVEEAKLRDGNWNAREDTGGMLARARWGGILEEPLAPIVRRVRGWDFAATRPRANNPDPDYTVGLDVEWDTVGRFYIAGFFACREDPPERDVLVAQVVSMDGPMFSHVIPIDPAAAGKDALVMHQRNFRAAGAGEILTRRPHKAKVVRATPVGRALRTGLKLPDGTVVPAGYILNRNGWLSQPYSDRGTPPSTLGALFWSQLDHFGTGVDAHDDAADALADAHAVGSAPVGRRPVSRARRAAQV